MSVNLVKREKKFNKEFEFNKTHPYYNTIKELYLNNTIKSISSASKQFKKLKITKAGKLYKTSAKAETTLINKVKKLTSVEDSNEIIVNVDNLNDSVLFNGQYITINHGIHMIMSSAIMKGANKDDFFMHTVTFYEPNGTISTKYEPIKFEFNKLRRKQLEKKINMNLNIDSDFRWIVEEFINGNKKINGRYVILKTYRFKKQENFDEQKRLIQIFKASASETCVYDGCLEYFANIKNKMAQAIYKKLIEKQNKYKKAYSMEQLNEIAVLCKASITIKDLVYGNNIVINQNNTNRYKIEFINTVYNHLSLYKCVTTTCAVVEVDAIEYENIKTNTSFYIEKYGKLYTLDNIYKIKKDEFQTVLNEWKDKIDYKNLSIKSESLAYKFLDSYDFNVHRFFNEFEINDNLYNEIDLKKAYYNYTNKDINKHYIGVPSGSFICVNAPEWFNIPHLNKLTNNKMVGFFEIEILTTNENLEVLGFTVGSVHTLASHTIKLISNYCKIKFNKLMYAPAIDIPFNEKFLNKTKDDVKFYCKAFGLMLCDSDLTVTTIKPERQDENFYFTLTKNTAVHKNKNIYKIYDRIENFDSWRHIAYFIHSYTTTQIIEQLMKYNIKTDIFGVKLDSIVLKKDVPLNIEANFDVKEAKIEKLLKVEQTITKQTYTVNDYGLDDGLDIKIENLGTQTEEIINYTTNDFFGYYKKSIKSDVKFDDSFLQTKELIKKRVVFIGGKGGTGKTYSLLNTSNINSSNICYTTSCWNLISAQKEANNKIIGLSLPKLTGEMNGIKVDKYEGNQIRYLIIDELTLINEKIVKQLINQFKNCFIFILGDVDTDGKYYQCSIDNKVIKPNKNMQYVRYEKSYRFDDELNNKLNQLREYMNKGPKYIYEVVKTLFKQNFKNKTDVNFNEGDIGISALKNLTEGKCKSQKKDGKCRLSQYYIDKGAKPQYTIKNTRLEKNQLRGQILLEKPEHKNYNETLFRTIHSFQGCQLNHNNKIIIHLDSLFDKNLLYTALSRARRVDQIIIIDEL